MVRYILEGEWAFVEPHFLLATVLQRNLTLNNVFAGVRAQAHLPAEAGNAEGEFLFRVLP